MRSTIFVVFLLAVSSVMAFAQSGRRVKTTPTPAAVTREPEFSESKPKPNRPVWISPADRMKQNQTAAIPAKPIADTTADSEEEVKVETNLVTIPVSVFDRNGL